MTSDRSSDETEPGMTDMQQQEAARPVRVDTPEVSLPPLPQPDHTLRAVKAALALKDAVAKLHQELPKEAHLSFGVGIHYGHAVLGWIGTQKRLEYTAIGDCVNTAKRIQENSARGQILLTREAYERVQDEVEAKPLPALSVKGKTTAVDVYEVVGLKM